ncbi:MULTISPECIES: biotin-dependent carboxyltransferase family protein [unclassified Saccharopolyspora]|uniref:5-oxoprolinase subunit C family protein n=1 Tax=unclassified Saccharopolyspora TaxID=2646250 RepID=UPI001CD5F951|nr:MULTISPECIES: biotin-dependent carboxyltransferase family protein [unclassified Saccharopolyspora]MCA1185195.1 biotin-dependent carboxyltransferase family protein [Saccharopolyspora sp. 6T]MCA1192572.1 biotin-dependent carboxyltransferase family protein [Saccharopolyspora sp. 6V]MCA1225292.1 biotin-dependent carboxyltransferase family protein [Saccharopolyspora sp. 6M]MCA1278916.1 biotin-dependent carboxyltransferase family protein [Saccharopolyspora sp. 7B]
MIEVVAPGPLATVQDLGRPGHAGIGVGVSGAADRGALRLANRLVGNPEGAAGIETTFGGLVLRPERDVTVAVTGADGPITVDGRAEPVNTVLRVRAGALLRLGTPACGLRGYVAVRGGIAVEPVLGSRATDVLSGLGPPRLAAGTRLPVGPAPREFPVIDQAPVRARDGQLVLDVVPGPRADWFTDHALAALLGAEFEVSAEIDRVGMRLDGPELTRCRDDELPSEGMALGSLQVPPSGRPTLFLADHPVTGGYPVIAVLLAAEVDRAAQARPGQRIRFRRTER